MNDAVKAMLKQFGHIKNRNDEENALKEIIQQISLLGLDRSGFFERAAFYGGTVLRLLHGLDRFSEDMDFCLLKPEPDFALSNYFEKLSEELERYGFTARITEKRTGPGAEIESAFVKQPTQQGLLVIGKSPDGVHKEQLIKVRLEVDKHNPPGAITAKRLVKLPVPFMVNTLDLPSLFAGKLHAILARAYLNRVKGRDYYDLQFYLARDIPVNAAYLEAKLRDSGHYEEQHPLTRPWLIRMLKGKIATVDFEKVKADVLPFVSAHGAESVATWRSELFAALVEEIHLV